MKKSTAISLTGVLASLIVYIFLDCSRDAFCIVLTMWAVAATMKAVEGEE